MLSDRERQIIARSRQRWDAIQLTELTVENHLDFYHRLSGEYSRLIEELRKETYAYTAVIAGFDDCIIGRADENVAGFTPCPSLGRWRTYAEAQKEADRLNEELGLDAREASRIVLSSVGAQMKNEQKLKEMGVSKI